MNDPHTPAQKAALTSHDVRLERRRILVDGTPRILLAGEVHYFRLHREDWADRLDELVASGCDAVAAYMPWLVHETSAGEIDLTGSTSPYRDLVGFLAQLQPGVLGSVKTCNGQWCRFLGQGFDGWIPQDKLWGVYPNEKVD